MACIEDTAVPTLGFVSLVCFLWHYRLLPDPLWKLPTFRTFQTVSHLLEGFPKAAGALFLLLAVTFKTAFLIGETRVGGLQLMFFHLEARTVGMFRHVRIPQPSVERHQARSLFCKVWNLVIQSLQLSSQWLERLSRRG
jgi:hypothetical protein